MNDKKFVFGMCPNRHSAGGGGTKFVNYFSEKLVGRSSFQFNYDDPPDYVLLLSWHIADELAPKISQFGFKGDFIVPLPTPRIIINPSK